MKIIKEKLWIPTLHVTHTCKCNHLLYVSLNQNNQVIKRVQHSKSQSGQIQDGGLKMDIDVSKIQKINDFKAGAFVLPSHISLGFDTKMVIV